MNRLHNMTALSAYFMINESNLCKNIKKGFCSFFSESSNLIKHPIYIYIYIVWTITCEDSQAEQFQQVWSGGCAEKQWIACTQKSLPAWSSEVSVQRNCHTWQHWLRKHRSLRHVNSLSLGCQGLLFAHESWHLSLFNNHTASHTRTLY